MQYEIKKQKMLDFIDAEVDLCSDDSNDSECNPIEWFTLTAL